MSTAASVTMKPEATAAVHWNPFPGLRPFREDEEYLFFGREGQVDAMVNKLAANHFLAVVGTSGSGKSSLVNCGLRPALHGGLMARAGTAWRMAQFRPGSDPMRALAHALAQDGVLFRDFQAGGLSLFEIVETTLRMSKLGLIDIYEQAQLDKDVNLLVVVDQFEELFRYRQLGAGKQQNDYGVSEEATAFVNLLLEANNQSAHPIYVVVTMRSDFLGDCAQFPGLAEAINAGQYLVPRMTRDERRAAISGPIGVGGAEISPVLLTRLVNDVGDNPDQLSILQHALNRTWARWRNDSSGEGPVDLPHYEAIGTMAHALDQHAEKAYAELATPRQQQICEKLFKALTDKATDPRGVRRPTTVGTLCALAEATEAEVTEVIDVFRKPSRSFLMPPAGEALKAETVIDISHETLMRVWQRLNKWADDESRSARIYRRLAETSALYREGNAALWKDPDLQLALKWREQNQPNQVWARRYHPDFEAAIRFLDDSVAERVRLQQQEQSQRQRELRRARKIAWGAGAFSLLLFVIAGFAISLFMQAQRAEKEANQEKTKAELNEKAAAVNELLPKSPLKALVLAIQATHDNQSKIGKELLPRVQSSLMSALQVADCWHQFKAHEAPVKSVTMTPDGKTIVSGSDDGTVRLWDGDGRPIGEPLRGHKYWVRSVAITSDGKTIVSGSDDGKVRLWNAEGKPIGKPFTGHEATVTSVAITPDGKTIVSGSADLTVRLWNAEGRPIGEPLRGHRNWIRSVAITKDGNKIVSGSDPSDGRNDRVLLLWDLEGSHNGKPLTGHDAGVTSVAMTPDGNTIVSGSSNDRTVRLWDAQGKPIGKPIKHEAPVTSVAITPDGNTIVSGSNDTTIRLWDRNGTPMAEPKWCKTPIASLAISPERKTIVSGSVDGTLSLWALEHGPKCKLLTPDGPLAQHKTELSSIAISQDGKVIVGGSTDGIVRWWDDRGQEIGKSSIEQKKGKITSVAISPDKKHIVTGDDQGNVRLWETEGSPTGALLIEHKPRESVTAVAIAITPDGKTIVSGGDKGFVWLLDPRTGAKTQIVKPEGGGSQDDESASDASASREKITSLAIDPTGKRIIAGQQDGTVMEMELGGAGTVTKVDLLGHTRAVTSVAWSPDGNMIVSSSSDGTVRLWDKDNNGKRVAKVLRGDDEGVTFVAIDPKNKYIASSGATVRLWNRQGNPMGNPLKHFPSKPDQGVVLDAFSFDADSQRIVTVSRATGAVWLNDVNDPDTLLRKACRQVRSYYFEPDIQKAEGTDTKMAPIGQDIREICLEKGGWTEAERADFLVRYGRSFAQAHADDPKQKELNRATATTAFQQALKLNPKIDLDPDTKGIDQDAAAAAKRLAARAAIWEGHKLASAQDPNLKSVIGFFEEAHNLDPTIALDPTTDAITNDSDKFARQLVAQAIVWRQQRSAKDEETLKKTNALKEAQKLDRDIDLDPMTVESDTEPEAVATTIEKRWKECKQKATESAQESVTLGNSLAKKWEMKKVSEADDRASKVDGSLELNASFWNAVAWSFCLRGHAEEALAASEKAVQLATEGTALANCRDTRGLARALTGDKKGAIEDFETAIGSDALPDPVKVQRQQWVEALKREEQPFTKELLEKLRSE